MRGRSHAIIFFTMNVPITKKENVSDEIHGLNIPDPYRWLENGNDPNVKIWVQTQNEYTDFFLKGDTSSFFSTELLKIFKVTNFSTPFPVRGRYFYTERQSG